MAQAFKRETISERIMENIDSPGRRTMVVKNVPTAQAQSYSGGVPFWLVHTDDFACPDRDDPAAEPLVIGQADRARFRLSRRRAAMPYAKKNIGSDEIHFIHRGRARIETEVGDLEGVPGRFVFLARGVGFRVIPESDDFVSFIVESDDVVELDKGMEVAKVPVIQPGDLAARKGGPAAERWVERIVCEQWTAELVRDYDPLATAEIIGESKLAFAVDADAVPAHAPNAPAKGVPLAVFSTPSWELQVSKRIDPLPFYHRNINRHEVEFVHLGSANQDSELGYIEAPAGSFYNVPRGIGHSVCNRTPPVIALIWEGDGNVALRNSGRA
jgi:hypothetical protein